MKSQVFDLVDEMRIIQRIFQFLTLIDHVIDKPSAMSFISQYSIYLLDAAVFSDWQNQGYGWWYDGIGLHVGGHLREVAAEEPASSVGKADVFLFFDVRHDEAKTVL